MNNMNKKNMEKQSKIFYSRTGLTELSITDNALYITCLSVLTCLGLIIASTPNFIDIQNDMQMNYKLAKLWICQVSNINSNQR